MTIPSTDHADALIKFLAKELYLNNVAKPLQFKGILNNKFVKFGKLFRGEVVSDIALRFSYNNRE